jgi:hypothetical protein
MFIGEERRRLHQMRPTLFRRGRLTGGRRLTGL